MISYRRLRFIQYKVRLGTWLVRVGRRLAPVREPEWETRVYRRNDPRFLDAYSGSVHGFASVCFSMNGEVDCLALAQSNDGRVIIRTLGTRFSREQIAQITYHKVAGILVEFEDAGLGIVYDRCRYEDVMESAA